MALCVPRWGLASAHRGWPKAWRETRLSDFHECIKIAAQVLFFAGGAIWLAGFSWVEGRLKKRHPLIWGQIEGPLSERDDPQRMRTPFQRTGFFISKANHESLGDPALERVCKWLRGVQWVALAAIVVWALSWAYLNYFA